MALGFQLALIFLMGIGGGFFLGSWADGFFRVAPFGMLAGIFLGSAAAFWVVVRFVETKNNKM